MGSNAVYRRAALEEVGGTAEIGHSEDVHTGFYALTRGWKLRYIPLALACGVSPDTPRAFFAQQMRWCSGSTTLLTNKDFWKSPLSPVQKICYLSGMMYYTAAAFMAFIFYWHSSGDVSQAKTEADCQKAGGMWDSKMNMCMEKKQ